MPQKKIEVSFDSEIAPVTDGMLTNSVWAAVTQYCRQTLGLPHLASNLSQLTEPWLTLLSLCSAS